LFLAISLALSRCLSLSSFSAVAAAAAAASPPPVDDDKIQKPEDPENGLQEPTTAHLDPFFLLLPEEGVIVIPYSTRGTSLLSEDVLSASPFPSSNATNTPSRTSPPIFSEGRPDK
jgi:hypothetical protein